MRRGQVRTEQATAIGGVIFLLEKQESTTVQSREAAAATTTEAAAAAAAAEEEEDEGQGALRSSLAPLLGDVPAFVAEIVRLLLEAGFELEREGLRFIPPVRFSLSNVLSFFSNDLTENTRRHE